MRQNGKIHQNFHQENLLFRAMLLIGLMSTVTHRFEEKPINRTHINAGVYVLTPAALNELKAKEHCDMPTLFERLQVNGERTVAYPMHEPWLDVGRPSDYEMAQRTGAAT